MRACTKQSKTIPSTIFLAIQLHVAQTPFAPNVTEPAPVPACQTSLVMPTQDADLSAYKTQTVPLINHVWTQNALIPALAHALQMRSAMYNVTNQYAPVQTVLLETQWSVANQFSKTNHLLNIDHRTLASPRLAVNLVIVTFRTSAPFVHAFQRLLDNHHTAVPNALHLQTAPVTSLVLTKNALILVPELVALTRSVVLLITIQFAVAAHVLLGILLFNVCVKVTNNNFYSFKSEFIWWTSY